MQSLRRWKRGQAHRCTFMLGDGGNGSTIKADGKFMATKKSYGEGSAANGGLGMNKVSLHMADPNKCLAWNRHVDLCARYQRFVDDGR